MRSVAERVSPERRPSPSGAFLLLRCGLYGGISNWSQRAKGRCVFVETPVGRSNQRRIDRLDLSRGRFAIESHHWKGLSQEIVIVPDPCFEVGEDHPSEARRLHRLP